MAASAVAHQLLNDTHLLFGHLPTPVCGAELLTYLTSKFNVRGAVCFANNEKVLLV